MTEVSLRPATAADLPFLRHVYGSTREPEMALLPWAESEKSAFCDMQFSLQDRGYRGAYPHGEFLVVRCASDDVGRLYRASADGVMHILDIALLPPWRNRGIGTRLVRETMAIAAASGLPVQLHVEKANPAQRLYARLGFREVQDTGIYLRLEWRDGTSPGSPG